MLALFGRKKISQAVPAIEPRVAMITSPAPGVAVTHGSLLNHPTDTSAETSGDSVLDHTWQQYLHTLNYAFQPVVNIHSGHVYGVEALVRGYADHGFASVTDLLDAAHHDGQLSAVETSLKGKALEAFVRWPFHHDRKLFMNIDARIFETPNPDTLSHIRTLIHHHELEDSSVILDISERAPLGSFLRDFLTQKKTQRSALRYAIDDFGSGLGSLQILYGADPDFIKIDRTLLNGVDQDARKKIFFSHIVSIAHLLGVMVVAEGVETEAEYFICKEVGCDLVQGFLVCPPVTNTSDIAREYPTIRELSSQDRRQARTDERILLERMEPITPLRLDTRMLEVFERFRAEKNRTFFPVIDASGEPHGIVREGDLKEYTYSQFGRDLMTNRSYGRTLSQFLSPCPIAALSLPAERILEIFSGSSDAEGLIIVDGQHKYAGFLSANALLRVINDKNLTIARDQNPLSRLPGNTVIHEYLSECLADASAEHVMVYFDFDNFKPFNDHYGFRQGDRAIQAFADILRRNFDQPNAFIAHVGGDDFVAGGKGIGDFSQFLSVIEQAIATFSDQVSAYYDQAARQRGFIIAHDRYGTERSFPLLTVSAAIIRIRPTSQQRGDDHLGPLIAGLKKAAKNDPSHIAIGCLA